MRPASIAVHCQALKMVHAPVRDVHMPETQVPEKIKERLYPVVLDLFSSQDFHQVNMREISRRTGLSSSTLYRYYRSKEAMVFAILEDKISLISDGVQEHIKGLESAREMIRKSFWITFDFYDNNPGVAVTAFITVPMRTWMQTPGYRSESTKDIITQIIEHGKARGEILPDVTASQALDLYYMFCYRQIHKWYFHGRKWKLVDAIPRFFDLFWRAVSGD
ncbi:transcriptional regulator, TetR family [Desulfatibacillum alkenivorans DSM 16219]|jgi:AcrR family transcriptional regulator|uniref:Transcriptional regulator, TetR family n=2 Tax=Desulfatibacillum alkenivorans TaxID=259354 RepID=A0A1M6QLM9_9BACT|nr:transcriptional regulator, TetR family [Desulfatibacillum alkenivorans DSM 16219]